MKLSTFPLLLLVFLIFVPSSFAGDQILYAYDDGAGQIRYYVLDKKTGTPTEHAASPATVTGGDASCGGNCQTLTADSKRRFLFAGTGSGLSVLRRAKDGSLTEVAGSPFGATGTIIGVGVYRKGKVFVAYALDNDAGMIFMFSIDKDTGAATLLPTMYAIGTAGGPVGVAVGKKFLYAVNQGDGTIHGFAIDKKTGELMATPGSPYSIPGITDPFNIVLDGKGRGFIVNDCDGGGYGLAITDKKTGEVFDSTTLSSTSGCTEVIGLTKNSKVFYGVGGGGIDVFENVVDNLGPVPSPFVNTDVGVLGLKARNLYLVLDNDLAHMTIDKKTKLPLIPAATTLMGTFTNEVTGMIILK